MLLGFFLFGDDLFFVVDVEAAEIAGFGGIQRGSDRVEYADGVFSIRSVGANTKEEGGRELQINTHGVKTRSDWKFWDKVQCREKLYLGKDDDSVVEVGERLETIFASVESLTNDVTEANANLRADNANLRASLSSLEAKVDVFF